MGLHVRHEGQANFMHIEEIFHEVRGQRGLNDLSSRQLYKEYYAFLLFFNWLIFLFPICFVVLAFFSFSFSPFALPFHSPREHLLKRTETI